MMEQEPNILGNDDGPGFLHIDPIPAPVVAAISLLNDKGYTVLTPSQTTMVLETVAEHEDFVRYITHIFAETSSLEYNEADGWSVICDTPCGQMSWRIDQEALKNFLHLKDRVGRVISDDPTTNSQVLALLTKRV